MSNFKSVTKELNISDLIPAPFQPPSRTLKAYLNELLVGLEKYGQRTPISIIDRHGEYHIVDGHRRVAAASILGWTTIAASIRKDDSEDAVAIGFEQSNIQRKLTGYESQEVFVENPIALPNNTRVNITRAKLLLGDNLFNEVVSKHTAVAVSLMGEVKQATSKVGTVHPRIAVKMEDNFSEVASRILEYGIGNTANIRKNNELTAIQCANKYISSLKLRKL